MSKKRKSLATSLEEVDRTVYSTFCSGANSLSQLYSQAMSQQKLSFQAGERHGLEKLYQWILRQQEEGSRVAPIDIVTYLQADLDRHGDDAPLPNQQSQSTMHNPVTNLTTSVESSVAPTGVIQLDHGDHQRPKNDVFSNALSSPVRRSLQNYHIAQRNYFPNSVQNEIGSNGPHLDRNQVNSGDSSMDMHADSPGHESSYRQK